MRAYRFRYARKDSTVIILGIFLIIFGGIVTFFTVKKICVSKRKKYDDFILRNSICLKQLTEINNRYQFYPIIDLNQEHTYDNEKFYDNISCKDYLIYQLQFIKKKVVDQIGKIDINKKRYTEYVTEIKTIDQFGRFYDSPGKIKIKKLLEREKKIFENEIYSAPITQFYLTVTLYCATIRGYVYSRKVEIFYDKDIMQFIARLNKKNGAFYTDCEIWNSICRVERGRVSNKMRFSIYARDGYRCCICGASRNFAQLEIDHIIPIAKGGKSVYNNLQTLCHRCNIEKGDNIY